MRILAVADERDEELEVRLAKHDLAHPDVVISCGDLSPTYLDYVATLANAQLLYVRGNHDTDDAGYGKEEGATYRGVGGIALDGRIERIGGLRIAGLDGSILYREGIVGYSERAMRMRVMRLAMLARVTGGIDVLVTHAPARGYGDLDDYPHRGFACFNGLLTALRPKLMLHGHVHLSYDMLERERVHPSGTRIVNACGYWEGEL